MLKLVTTMMLVGGLALSSASAALAFPANGGAIVTTEDATSMVQEARIFCYNRYTGRFLHWGSCGGGYGGYHHPRVYCRNRYTGRFIHWGAC